MRTRFALPSQRLSAKPEEKKATIGAVQLAA